MKKNPLTEADCAFLARYDLDAAAFPLASRFSFVPGEYLSRQGEALEYLYFVLSGKAKVLLGLSDGKQMLLAHFISQGIIGDIELMTDVAVHAATLQAVTQFECLALPLRAYRGALKANLAFVNRIGKELAEKLLQRAVNSTINTLQSLEARLCAYILQTAPSGQFTETRTEVAAMMGASYRHLLRCFNNLCERGILEKQPKGYRIANHAALRRMAGDLYVIQ